MSGDNGRWKTVTESEFDHEREALVVIRDMVSGDPSAHCWSNVSFQDDRGYSAEIDLLMINRAGIWVIELKHWLGEVTGRMNDWERKAHKNSVPQRERNPRVKAELNAKKLKSLLETEPDQVGLKRVPWVDAVLVMHGKGSIFRLDDSASHGVFALDRYNIRGLDTFSSFLKQAPTRQQPLDGPAIKALVKLIEGAGLAPIADTSADDDPLPVAEILLSAVSEAQPDPGPPVVQDLFSAVTSHELSALGVPDELIGALRAVPDQQALIGLFEDAIVETLWEVLAGTSVADVIEQRQTSAVFEQVDAEHAALEASAELVRPAMPEAETQPNATGAPDLIKSQPAEAPPVASVDLEPLATKFTVRSRKWRPPTHDAAPSPSRSEREVTAPAPAAGLVKSEQLLALARSEALQGRIPHARRLVEEVRGHIRRNGVRPWTSDDLDAFKERVRDAAMLSIRLESLTPQMPVPRAEGHPADASAVGHLWPSQPSLQAYSLLLREPDILDRRTGVYLSQVIGENKAAAVNARLRRGRPDGGRIRMSTAGTVVSRRDADAPWFVVGTVAPDEWFTPALTI